MLLHGLLALGLLLVADPWMDRVREASLLLVAQLQTTETIPLLPKSLSDGLLSLFGLLAEDSWQLMRQQLLQASAWLVLIVPWIHGAIAWVAWLYERRKAGIERLRRWIRSRLQSSATA